MSENILSFEFLQNNEYIVRSEDGVRKAATHFENNSGYTKPDKWIHYDEITYPQKYPSIVSFTHQYDGGHYYKIDYTDVDVYRINLENLINIVKR